MSPYYKMTPKEIKEAEEEEIYQRITKERYNKKIKEYYIKETKYYTKMKDEADKSTNYDRMNQHDRLQQNIWNLAMTQLMNLQEKYYNNIKY